MDKPSESSVYGAIREAIALRERGRSPEAKALLETLAADVNSEDDVYAKIFLAHSLADVQETPGSPRAHAVRRTDRPAGP